MDKVFSNPVPSVPNVPSKNDRLVKKTADIEETQREHRRGKVLASLAANPNTQRAFITDTKTDPDNVIVTIAIRDQYTFEMTIPREKYDAFLIVELIEKAQIQ